MDLQVTSAKWFRSPPHFLDLTQRHCWHPLPHEKQTCDIVISMSFGTKQTLSGLCGQSWHAAELRESSVPENLFKNDQSTSNFLMMLDIAPPVICVGIFLELTSAVLGLDSSLHHWSLLSWIFLVSSRGQAVSGVWCRDMIRIGMIWGIRAGIVMGSLNYL